MEFLSGNFLIETIVPKDELIVSRTDLKGIITYANETFAKISGYNSDELIGKSHNIVRHPDMPKSVFKNMWNDLHTKGRWSGIVKNLRKDEGFYWVYAEVSQVFRNDKLVEYKSIRSPISFQDKKNYQLLYDELRERNNEVKRIISYK
ncbi:PAS domain-containing protein [Aliarcobacter vitoriensis]|uniref:PAS domain-containing protein n=1 Tax=Aliarcobacter vitoriensis TaxID=2011099 RepID=UPI003AACCF76